MAVSLCYKADDGLISRAAMQRNHALATAPYGGPPANHGKRTLTTLKSSPPHKIEHKLRGANIFKVTDVLINDREIHAPLY